jgi:hypothetical protein
LLRDDDANATTDPRWFAKIYAPILDAGLPLNLSVIPEVRLDTRAPDGAYERFLCRRAGDTGTEPLAWDSPIAAWMRERRAQVVPLQHGWTHERVREGTEFGALDEGEAARRILRGRQVLERALGERAAGFVAPWDALSSGALLAAASAYKLVSTSWLDRSKLPVGAWPTHVAERLQRREALRLRGSWVLRHRGGPVHDRTDPREIPSILRSLSDGASVTVVVLHHWMFDGVERHPVLTALVDALRAYNVVSAREAGALLDGDAGSSTTAAFYAR